jgi:hypothetical protein
MLNDTLQRVLKAADYFGKTLYQLRAQLIVSALAFLALSGVGELRQLYRNIVLENNDGSYGFTIAVVSVVLLSGFIWLSSVITLFPEPESRQSSRLSIFLHELRTSLSPRTEDMETSAAFSPAKAAIVGFVAILPILGLAVGLRLAIPRTLDGVPLPVPREEPGAPDRVGPQNRTELPLIKHA